MVLTLWFLWCACILIFGQTYNLYIILACTEVNNGIEGSHQNWQGFCRMVNLSLQPLHGATMRVAPFHLHPIKPALFAFSGNYAIYLISQNWFQVVFWQDTCNLSTHFSVNSPLSFTTTMCQTLIRFIWSIM